VAKELLIVFLRAKVMDEVLVFMKSKGVQSFGAVT
jgi:hypothetical protein